MIGADARPRSSRPLGDRVCDAFVVAFAGWTLLCHAVVYLGGGLRTLVGLAAIAAIAAALGSGLARRRRRLSRDLGRVHVAADEPESAGPGAPGDRAAPRRFLVAAGGAALICALALFSKSVPTTWWCAVVLLLVGLAWELRRGGEWLPARRSPGWEAALWSLAVLGAILPLLAHRPNQDDAFYVNLAVAAVDAPGDPLLRGDTLYGIAGLPLLLSTYRVHSVEMLAAALAWISPWSPIQVCHLLLPALFGLLVPLAMARLARIAAPRSWLWVTAGVVAVLLLAGGVPLWFSNQGFVRLHQGKSVFVTVLAPLSIAAGLEFGRAPRGRTWIALAAVQVASVGFSATALWQAPFLTGLGVVTGCLLSQRRLASVATLRILAIGAAASAYLMALGLILRSSAATANEAWSKSFESWGESLQSAVSADNLAQLDLTWRRVMGGGPWSLVCLFAVLSAWGFCADAAGRRLALVLPLGSALLLSPFTADFVAEHLTGSLTYFRILWGLPIPFLLALILASPWSWDCLPIARGLRIAGAGVAAALLLVLVPDRAVLGRSNDVRWQPFGLKVPPVEYAAAVRLVASVPPRSRVHAPNDVSVWIGTFREHPYALVPRTMYLRFLAQQLGDEEEAQRRLRLSQAFFRKPIPATSEQAIEILEALERYELAGWCIPFNAEGTRRILAHAGWVRADGDAKYEIWVRPGPAPLAR